MTIHEPPIKVSVGLIGGTGVYDPRVFKAVEEHKVYTPYGATSDKLLIGEFKGRRVAFLARHGRQHNVPPHLVNYQANIWAMKALGVRRLITVSAVGSLQDELEPGHLVIPDQFVDWTKSRKRTFFEGGPVAHVSLENPFCSDLRQFIVHKATDLKLIYHDGGTCITIEGPQFSTRAESLFYRAQGWHIIGMTLNPEVNLAREAQICFANIAMITDYDVYAARPVSHEEVQKTMKANLGKVRRLLEAIISDLSEKQDKCDCDKALRGAVG